jgi:hypothetical protein
MKRYFLIVLFFSILLPKTSMADSYVTGWISAMKNSGTGLNSIITSDFEYRQLNFDFGKKLFKGSKGDLPFFAKSSRPSNIEIEETRAGSDGQVVVLNNVSENGFFKEWQTVLLIRADGIARVSEIAFEGQMRGHPPGCPETMYKRKYILTLHGNPSGFSEPKAIKLYTYRRDTDPLEYAHLSLSEKDRKKCTPTPDRQATFSEVAVFDLNGQLNGVNNVAITNKGAGGIFIREDGTNFPGRLFNVGGGKEGLLLTFAVQKKSEKSTIAKLYLWRGSGWKSVWAFDVGHGSGSGFGGGSSGDIEWFLKSIPDSNGTPEILARLDKNNDKGYSCPVGTSITYAKSGSGFKPMKAAQDPACYKRNLSGSLMASPGKDEKAKEVVSEGDVDWRFE